MKKQIVVVLLIVLSPILIAKTNIYTQQDIEIKQSINTNATTYIGDEIKYTLDLSYNKDVDIKVFSDNAYFGEFEINSYDDDGESKDGKDRLKRTITYNIAAYTVGEIEIPEIEFEYNLSDEVKSITLKSYKVAVEKITNEIEDKDGDIPNIFNVLSIPFSFIPILIVLALILIIGLSIFFILKYVLKKDKVKLKIPSVPEDIEALKNIEKLLNKNYIEEGKYIEFYLELTEILRKYISLRFDVKLLEKTTKEIDTILYKNNIPKNRDIVDFLKYADYVKFAKYSPEKKEIHSHIEFSTDYIKSTKKTDEDKKS